ncbi:hypothetical protein Tco_0188664 [Tanacetum coccineum]
MITVSDTWETTRRTTVCFCQTVLPRERHASPNPGPVSMRVVLAKDRWLIEDTWIIGCIGLSRGFILDNTGPAGLVQRAKLLKENVFILDLDGALMSTQEYMQKVVEDVGGDDDFNSGAWNALGDLNVTLKDLSGTVPGTIHYKVLDVSSYEKDITVGAAMILVNVSVFTPKPSKHYLNITKRNVVEVFRKDTVSLA